MSPGAIPHPILALLPTLAPVATVVEIGCHRMEDTAHLRAAYPQARIICFEPDPTNLQLANDRGLPTALNASLYPVALCDREGSADFYLSTRFAKGEAEWSRSSSLRRPTVFHPRSMIEKGIVPCVFCLEPLKVRCATLDGFLTRLGMWDPVDLLWIDAQGAEDMILRGAATTLKTARWLFIEHNTDGCYEGAPDLAALLVLLPGWQMVHQWPHDALLLNPAAA